MTSILSLATETLQEIALKAERDAVKSLRSVNRRLNLAIEPIYFSSMKMDMNRPSSQFEDLATNKTRASIHVQELEILPFKGFRVNRKWEMELKVYLAAALCSFNKLHFLIWRVASHGWLERCVAECLGAQTSITSLELDILAWNPKVPLPHFGAFDHLQSLSVYSGATLVRSIAQTRLVDVNYATLSKLSLVNPECDSSFWVDVDIIFRGTPVEHPLQLTHLVLGGWTVGDMDLIIPHLKSLRSLELKQQGSKLWVALQAAEIWLQEIRVGVIDEGLLDYLSSYSTLQRFSAAIETDQGDPYLVSRFYEGVLPKHCDSILQLAFDSEILNTWCFSLDHVNTKYISCCKNLEDLTMTIDPKDVRYTGGGTDIITALLDITNVIPDLHSLTIALVPGERIEAQLNARIKIWNAVAKAHDQEMHSGRSSARMPCYDVLIRSGKSMPLVYKWGRSEPAL